MSEPETDEHDQDQDPSPIQNSDAERVSGEEAAEMPGGGGKPSGEDAAKDEDAAEPGS